MDSSSSSVSSFMGGYRDCALETSHFCLVEKVGEHWQLLAYLDRAGRWNQWAGGYLATIMQTSAAGCKNPPSYEIWGVEGDEWSKSFLMEGLYAGFLKTWDCDTILHLSHIFEGLFITVRMSFSCRVEKSCEILEHESVGKRKCLW